MSDEIKDLRINRKKTNALRTKERSETEKLHDDSLPSERKIRFLQMVLSFSDCENQKVESIQHYFD
jgi:hypothetical protein